MCEQCLYRTNCQFLAKHKPSNIKGCTAFKSEKELIADTVKKMQEKLHEEAFYEILYHEERHLVNLDDIDRIAKEILEGTQND